MSLRRKKLMQSCPYSIYMSHPKWLLSTYKVKNAWLIITCALSKKESLGSLRWLSLLFFMYVAPKLS